MSKLDTLRKEMKAIKSKMKKEGQAAMKEAFKELFDKHPTLEAVGWDQYTPYFNDGDACTFNVYDMYPVFVKTAEEKKAADDSYGSEAEEWDDYEYGDKKLSKEQKAANKALTTLVNKLGDMDEIFLDLFGDHVNVRATRSGFKVTECEHD